MTQMKRGEGIIALTSFCDELGIGQISSGRSQCGNKPSTIAPVV